MRQEQPLVSICILCFNAETTIRRAILSAFKQDYENKEIIVVDDCSVDNSLNLLRTLKKKYRFKLITHEINTGPGGARYKAVKAAKGKFITFFDDDDFSNCNRVRIQLETILTYEKKLQSKKIACYASGTRLYQNGYKVDASAIGSKFTSPLKDSMLQIIFF